MPVDRERFRRSLAGASMVRATNPNPIESLQSDGTAPGTEIRFRESQVGTGRIGPQKPEPSFVDELTGFGATAGFEATGGLIGMEPPDVVSEFKERNPGFGFAASLLGTAVPFVVPFAGQGALGIKLAAKVPGLMRMAQFSKGATEARPFAAGAAKAFAEFVPFEVARLGAAGVYSASQGDLDPLKQTALHVGVDLPLFAAFGGGFAKAAGVLGKRAAAVRAELGAEARVAGGLEKELGTNALLDGQGIAVSGAYPINGSLQERMRWLNTIAAHEGFGNFSPGFQSDVNLLLRGAPGEVSPLAFSIEEELTRVGPIKGQRRLRYIQGLAGAAEEAPPVAAGRALRELDSAFTPGVRPKGTFDVHTFNAQLEDPLVAEGVEKARAVIMTDATDHSMVQFPRLFVAKSGKKAQSMRESFAELSGGPADSPRGIFVMQEPENGLFVVAQRIKGKGHKPGTGRKGDQWLLFKTDQPDKFLPRASAFGETMKDSAFKLARQYDLAPGLMTPSLEFMHGLEQVFDPETILANATRKGAVGTAIEQLQRTHVAAGEAAEVAGRASQYLRSIVAPGTVEFSKSPRAQAIFAIAKGMANRAENAAGRIFIGTPKRTAVTGPGLQLGVEAEGGIRPLVKEVYSPVNRATAPVEFMSAVADQAKPEDLVARGMGEASRKLYTAVYEAMQKQGVEMSSTRTLLSGNPENTMVSPEELMNVLFLRGSHRQRIREKATGEVIGLGSGNNPKIARQDAERQIAATTNPELFELSGEGVFYNASSVEDKQILQAMITDGLKSDAWKILQEGRKAVFKAEPKSVLSKSELDQALLGNFTSNEHQIASEIINNRLSLDLQRLNGENKEAWVQVKDRLLKLQGLRGDKNSFGAKLDEQVDKILGPVMGRHSASSIVSAMNRGLFTLTMGAGDLGFAALNALTPVMTALPEMAFVLNAGPRELQKYYAMNIAKLADGTIQPVSFLEPLKIMRQSFKEWVKPDEVLLRNLIRGFDDRVIDKKFVEAIVGRDLGTVFKFGEITEEGGITKMLTTLSEFLPGQTETYSRAHTFTMGHIIGRDFFGLKDEALYQFARTMTDRSMFLYSTAARARMITGNLGTAFGLFKNWMMHYLANHATYLGEGFTRGNWNPLLWSAAGAGSLGGIAAIPGFGTADSFVDFTTGKGTQELVFDAMGYGQDESPLGVGKDATMDALFYGLPSFLGITLKGRAAAPSSDITRDLGQLSSFMLMDRATHLGGALSDSWAQWRATGQHPVDSVGVRDQFIRAFAPRSVYRWQSFTEDGALKSLKTQRRLFSDVSLSERAAFAFGITPLNIEKYYAISSKLYDDQNELRAGIATFGEMMSEAMQLRDGDMQRELVKRAVEEGLPLESIFKSANRRLSLGQEDLIDQQFDAAKARAVRRSFRGNK